MRLSLVVALAALAIALPAFAQTVPDGYRIHAPDRTIDLSLRQDTPSAFHVVIVRRAGAAEDEWRLRLAESVHPSRDSSSSPQSCLPGDTVTNAWRPGCRPPVPTALTATVVRQHIDWIAALRRGDAPSRGQPLQSASLRYEATGQWESEIELAGRRYADVYVARLRLMFRGYCGFLCGWSFAKDRVVVVSRAGDVLAVTGDGPTQVKVSQ
jgi:hypothetical protein